MIHHQISKKLLAVGAIAVLLGLGSCKSTTTSPTTTPSTAFSQTVLIADTLGYGATQPLDPTYKNGWGISLGSTGNFWLSSNHGGVTNVYSAAGTAVPGLNPVKIPSRNGTDAGSPTGVVFNTNLPDFGGNFFIYSSEDGIISGWKGGSSAVKIATDPSANAVYKGLAMASTGGKNYLYAADFKENKIVVYDNNLMPATLAGNFTESGSPAFTIGTPGFGPFGVQNIGGLLYVTYARHKLAPDDGDDAGGTGNGYVSVFKPDGTWLRRFASQGTLSSPWGVAAAPSTFTQFKNAILISNFGDGTISGFVDSTGDYLGQVSTDVNNTPMHISGIWGLLSTGATPPMGGVANALYFTAGPGGENHGTFGYIKPQ